MVKYAHNLMANIPFPNAWTHVALAISLLPQRRWKKLKKQCWNCTATDQTWKMVIQYLMWDVVGDRWHYTLPRSTLTAELQESAIPQLKRLTLRKSAGMLLDIPFLALRPYALALKNLIKQMTLWWKRYWACELDKYCMMIKITFFSSLVRDLQLQNINTIVADISTFEMEASYDRIFSIGMFEVRICE